MRQRRVDVHGFQRGQAALGLGLCVKRAHIVQAVAELDEDDPHVLRHGKQHLAQIFDVRLFLVLNPQGDDLRQPVNQHGNVRAEFLLDLVQVGLVRAVLHRVVQERSADGIGVQFQTRHNLRHGNRVGDIRFSARAHLPAVHLVCIFVCRTDLVRVVLFSRRAQNLQQTRDIGVYRRIAHRYDPFYDVLQSALARRDASSTELSRSFFPPEPSGDSNRVSGTGSRKLHSFSSSKIRRIHISLQ